MFVYPASQWGLPSLLPITAKPTLERFNDKCLLEVFQCLNYLVDFLPNLHLTLVSCPSFLPCSPGCRLSVSSDDKCPTKDCGRIITEQRRVTSTDHHWPQYQWRLPWLASPHSPLSCLQVREAWPAWLSLRPPVPWFSPAQRPPAGAASPSHSHHLPSSDNSTTTWAPRKTGETVQWSGLESDIGNVGCSWVVWLPGAWWLFTEYHWLYHCIPLSDGSVFCSSRHSTVNICVAMTRERSRPW